MARPTSQALGGFFPTPTNLLAPIAELIDVAPGEAYSMVDPCAADGEALTGIMRGLFTSKEARAKVDLYACEMERSRYEALKRKEWETGAKLHHTHGDAMRLVWSTEQLHRPMAGASLLFANPPYDHDREFKRLEERFLVRFAPCLADDGVLVFLVPFYELAASADTLARNFTGLSCLRFPDVDFDAFKQVVLVGNKRPTLREPDPAVKGQVMAWSESIEGMPILGTMRHVVTMPGHKAFNSGFTKWAVAALDVQGLLAKVKPWQSTDRAGRFADVPGVVPAPGDLLARRYPLAVPPKPAHLAAAIASGVFNGAEVRPDSPDSALPRLRVKGVFVKEFVKAEDKKNKDGEKTGEVQIQQPKLVVTVLDVDRAEYVTLGVDGDVPNMHPASVEQLTTQGLLRNYGRALMNVMLAQCPVLHDPANDAERWPMPKLARPLYAAQEETVRALVKLLGGVNAKRSERQGKAAYLLGEIGSGKSGCATVVAQVIGARKVLVMCPPHLLQGWTDQVNASVLGARVSVLDSVDAVDAWGSDPWDGLHIGVMSREAAKLSHGYEGVTGSCPKCGSVLPIDKDGITMSSGDLARTRKRCEAKRTTPVGAIAKAARDIALLLMRARPESSDVNQLIRGRMRDKFMLMAHGRSDEAKARAWMSARSKLVQILDRLARRMLRSERGMAEALGAQIVGLLAAINEDDVTASLVERVYQATMFDAETYGTGASVRSWARDALLLMREPWAMADRLNAMGLHTTTNYAGSTAESTWDAWRRRALGMYSGGNDSDSYRTGLTLSTWNKHAKGTSDCAVAALAKLATIGTWRETAPCGEPLYQAIPEPRRIALANYIAKRRYPIDLFILDEAHEAAGDGSAQGLAAQRLVSLGMPTIALTGSVMNGYAESLFNNQWSLDPQFRLEFDRTQRGKFNKRYGYLKVLVQHTDKDHKVIEWGSQSDRRETKKEIGNAPGVLPLFMLRYLLRIAVTLHKTDLAQDLPPHAESVGYVTPDSVLMSRYETLLNALKREIKQSRFDPLLAGKLFGALSELPSYLDRATADCGNREDGSFAVAYPVNEELGPYSGQVIASFDGLPESSVMPKEKWMLETIERALKQGSRCMVFAWHESVLPRLHKLIEREIGEKAGLLLASKVQAKKRQDWIDEKVIKAKRRVLVVNGAAVKTGLNNLVWFQKTIWMENPGVDPQTKRQADGRIDRIGKKAATESCFPVYDGTLQATAMKLLFHKVAVSMAADGLDAESALAAAGVGESNAMDAFSVGRALWEMMERGEDGARPKTPTPARVAIAQPANDAQIERKAEAPKAKPKQLSLF